MESNGFPMCIHVSEPTMALLRDAADWCQYGVREIKGQPPPVGAPLRKL